MVKQIEGASHGGGNHRTSEHLADLGNDGGDGFGLGDNGQRSQGRQTK